MKIYIIDINQQKLDYVKPYFKDLEDVTIVNADLHDFLQEVQVDAIVSPANSFGLMDGGFDYAITKEFGTQLQNRVQRYIIDNLFGEQPVGTSIIVDAGKNNQKLIHTPTMRTPQPIKDVKVIYQCMRTTLMCAINNNIKSILIPLFGGSVGAVHPRLIGQMMRKAYDQVNNPPSTIDWDYVETVEIL